MTITNFGVDLVKKESILSIPIKWVGIQDFEVDICLLPLFENDLSNIQLTCKLNLYCDLNKNLRGIHLSRFSEALINLRESKPYTIFTFCEKLAQILRKVQNQEYGRVYLKCKHFVKIKNSISSTFSLIPLIIGVDVVSSSWGTYYTSLLDVKTIVACPCGLEMSKAVIQNNSSRNFSCYKDSQIDNYIGIHTHTQQALLNLTVENQNKPPIQHKYLLKIAEKVSPILGTTLKRPDEFNLIQKIHKNPMFCEDLVRKSLNEMKHSLKSLRRKESILKTSVKSTESIHPFTIFAYAEFPENK